MKIKNALAALPLTLNACGGDAEIGGIQTHNEPGFGIWEGAISASLINTTTSSSGAVSTIEPTSATGVGLYTSNNTAFFFKEDTQTLFTRGSPVVSGGVLYSTPYTFENGVDTGRVNFNSGDVYTSASLKGTYSAVTLGSISGNYALIFNDKYYHGADLSRLTGNWLYTDNNSKVWQLTVQPGGGFTGSSTIVSNCNIINGSFSTIDPDKNEYTMDLELTSCGIYDGVYKGIAATIDTNSEDDSLLLAIYTLNNSNAFFMKPLKQ